MSKRASVWERSYYASRSMDYPARSHISTDHQTRETLGTEANSVVGKDVCLVFLFKLKTKISKDYKFLYSTDQSQLLNRGGMLKAISQAPGKIKRKCTSL
ncbi:MAG: hypothetical protein IPO37_07545 [Saprospiraceae bacterium]|nr:hypothetical protein [Saprospiraceae bacterium]